LAAAINGPGAGVATGVGLGAGVGVEVNAGVDVDVGAGGMDVGGNVVGVTTTTLRGGDSVQALT